MPTRSGSAEWRGDLKGGHGGVVVGQGKWAAPFDFRSRFGDGVGTSPEELIAAAHSACFSMALSTWLGDEGHVPEWVRTTANVTLTQNGPSYDINDIELDCEANVPGMDEAEFQEIAERTRQNCAVSKLVSSAHISLHAKLVGETAATV